MYGVTVYVMKLLCLYLYCIGSISLHGRVKLQTSPVKETTMADCPALPRSWPLAGCLKLCPQLADYN
jgi:hypothetical protein